MSAVRPLATVLADAIGLPDPFDDTAKQAERDTQAPCDVLASDRTLTTSANLISESLLRLVEIGEQLLLHLRVHETSPSSLCGASKVSARQDISDPAAPVRGQA